MKRVISKIFSIVHALAGIVLITMFTISCSEDKSREVATEQAIQSVDSTQPIQAASTIPFKPVVVGTMSVKAAKMQASNGQQVCVPVTTTGFLNVVSMQYTMQWDPEILSFREIKSFGLPGLNDNNFGTNQAASGILTHSWYDLNVKGITLKDGAVLYEVCFDVTGDPGTKSAIRFTEDPVVFEVSDPQSNYLDMKAVNGMITVK